MRAVLDKIRNYNNPDAPQGLIKSASDKDKTKTPKYIMKSQKYINRSKGIAD